VTLSGRVRAAGVLSALLVSLGCYESPFPIDAAPQAEVEPALLGVWRCVPHDAKATEHPATITVARGRERMYAVTFQEDGKEADRYEVHASVVRGETILNTRDLSGGRRPWVFMRFVLLKPSVLQLQVLNGDALQEQTSPAGLRSAVERLRGKSGAYVDVCVCARARAEEHSQK
jgi:hypothetical protein